MTVLNLFIQPTYFPKIGVMSENIGSNNPLKNSNYHVFGKLFSDEMVNNWINGNVYK